MSLSATDSGLIWSTALQAMRLKVKDGSLRPAPSALSATASSTPVVQRSHGIHAMTQGQASAGHIEARREQNGRACLY